jgi:DNA polymerase-3 subunit alpha
MDNFVHLHNHTTFSLLDGIIPPNELAKQAKALGQVAVAITDHGSIAGWIKFYRACQSYNIKPILGCEIYIDCKEEYPWLTKPTHLTILAKDNEGYKNIIAMHNMCCIERGLKRIRIKLQDLFDHKDGIIVLSGCPNSIINKHIENDENPTEIIERFISEFGDEAKLREMLTLGKSYKFTITLFDGNEERMTLSFDGKK